MRKGCAIIAVLVAVTLCLPCWQGNDRAAATEINVLPYYGANNLKAGDYYVYSYDTPGGTPDFTVILTQVTTGSFAGNYRLGDFQLVGKGTDWRIMEWDATGITIHETGLAGVLSPPLIIDALQPLETLINFPINGSLYQELVNYWHYKELDTSVTVPAGTFTDVLLNFVFDETVGPNDVNAYFDLDPTTVPYGITEVTWLAAGVGEIQVADINAATGEVVSLYQLKATSVPLPASVLLLGSGLLGLIGWRKWTDR